MLKDIDHPKVEDVAIAVVHEVNELNEGIWTVFLLNLQKEVLQSVLVSSIGYGEIDGRKKTTTELRYFLEDIPSKSFRKVEPIMEDVFPLSNQYWVSYHQEGKVFDKKFVFVPDSIHERNLIQLPLIDKKGVMIK